MSSTTAAAHYSVDFQDVLSGKYHIILASPEMLQSRTFIDRLLRNSRFSRQVISLVVDEAHCVSHWGADFRKKYGTLGILRAFLARGTPVVALSATLTERVRRDLHSKLHFSKTKSRTVNVGNDRPNVSIIVRACQNTMSTYTDLDFVIPPNITKMEDIPKTWIYTDNIEAGSEIMEYLVDLLYDRQRARDIATVDRGIIRPFNARFSQEYRQAAMAQFRSGAIRIMVCTEAAGMVS